MIHPIDPVTLIQAQERIRPYIRQTPLLESQRLNDWLQARVLFKAEGYQVTGSFKVRGAINALLTHIERGQKPQKVAVFSSGNHAQGCAWACQLLGIPLQVFMPQNTSPLKVQATRSYGAQVIITATRKEAESLCEKAAQEGALRLPPFDDDDVIIGQGTLMMEILAQEPAIDAVFATCGGGGMLSGCYLSKQLLAHPCQIYGCEPELAADATHSYQSGTIYRFDTPPATIADGARTPAICERTFEYLKQIAGFYTATEKQIVYWCQWLSHLLKTPVEPTSAVAMAGAWKHLKQKHVKGPIVVLLSGANLSGQTQAQIWQKDFLESIPSLELDIEKL